MTNRAYTSRRYAIAKALAEKLSLIDGTGSYRTDVHGQAFPRLVFYENINSFPAICVIAGTEVRGYQGGGYKDRYLDMRILIYVKEENPLERCEILLEDIETVIEDNASLSYTDRDGNTQRTHDITISSLSTDEGALDPISVGEMMIRVHY